MEKVEVVIKIPKYYLTHPQDYSCLAECVRRGTPLPKGHGWIPVSERLPETDGMFLTYIVNPYDNRLSYIMICDYIRQTWCPVDETASSNVVAWMPLPEPYEPQESESDA